MGMLPCVAGNQAAHRCNRNLANDLRSSWPSEPEQKLLETFFCRTLRAASLFWGRAVTVLRNALLSLGHCDDVGFLPSIWILGGPGQDLIYLGIGGGLRAQGTQLWSTSPRPAKEKAPDELARTGRTPQRLAREPRNGL